MSFPILVAGSSKRSTVTVASQQFGGSMGVGECWELTSSIACYIAQGANPTAAATDGSSIVGPGVSRLIFGAQGAKLAILRIGSSDGEATLTKVQFISRG